MMQSNGTYRRVTNKATPVSAQSSLYEEALLAAAADKIPMEGSKTAANVQQRQ